MRKRTPIKSKYKNPKTKATTAVRFDTMSADMAAREKNKIEPMPIDTVPLDSFGCSVVNVMIVRKINAPAIIVEEI